LDVAWCVAALFMARSLDLAVTIRLAPSLSLAVLLIDACPLAPQHPGIAGSWSAGIGWTWWQSACRHVMDQLATH